jgi:3-isopropylmalate/(R)-2-methylmalate dehydratase small subunit
LSDFGIKCVISPSFADIFYNNCFKNGILPIILDEKVIQVLAEYSKRETEIEIKIETQEIIYGNKVAKFELDTFKKKCLIEGIDDIDLSLEKISNIQDYEDKIKDKKPWLAKND